MLSTSILQTLYWVNYLVIKKALLQLKNEIFSINVHIFSFSLDLNQLMFKLWFFDVQKAKNNTKYIDFTVKRSCIAMQKNRHSVINCFK